ncbi:ATP-binding protein [Verrucomicrobiota bacterium]
MKTSLLSNLSIERSSWRKQLAIAFTLMTIIPLLTLTYIITAYLMPNITTRESMLGLVTLNVILGCVGFLMLCKTINTLTNFRKYLEKVASGDLDSKLTIRNGPEVTSITKSVSMIVDTLQKDKERLKNTSAELAKKVENRTTELKQINTKLNNELSERKKTEQDLRDANMKLSDALCDLKEIQGALIQHERLSALGQMASGIAHDFNNLLMPIVGLSEFLLANPKVMKNEKELTETLKDIHSAGDDARKVVRRLKEFYKSEEGIELTATNMNDLIKRVITMTQPHWQQELEAKGIHITIKKEFEEIPPIGTNSSQIREVFTNLLINSIDAMPEGGTITVRSSSSDKWVTIEISDTGIGMTDETLKQCTEPFFTTKGLHGTGIGLSMAFGIIRRHQGTMQIESELGKGTTVTIRLPLMISSSTETQTDPIGEMDIIIPALKILIVEDDKRSRDLIKKYLETDKHTVTTADRGIKGIESFSKDQFDLVITDRAMPDMSGDKVAATISKQNPLIPIIMLTGFGEMMRDQGELPKGVNTVLGKPVTQKEVQHTIAKIFKNQKKASHA